MKTDTPPQPAHGQKVQVFYLCRHCNKEIEVMLSKLGYSDFFDCPKCSKRIDSWLRVPCANKREFEVHSKETMDEVRKVLITVLHSDGDTMISRSAIKSALAKLNPQ